MRIEIGGSRLYDLQRLGQSVWLDCNDPRLLASSRLTRLISDGISGIDSSAAALALGYAQDAARRQPIAQLQAAGATMRQIYDRLSIEDLRHAADRLRRIYDNGGGRDGYVNVDLPPALAHDAVGIESDARRRWEAIDRPNVMIKVPATDAGLIAVRRCIAAGLNINATLIFGARRYSEVTEAFLLGLEDRIAGRLPLERLASVASIPLGRIDTAVDPELDAIQPAAKAACARGLRGRTAVAVARFVYQRYKSMISSPRWHFLSAYHAQPQRLHWTGTGLPRATESDLEYVEELVGRDTVTTMSPHTFMAFLDRGAAAPTLERDLLEVLALIGGLETLGIDLDHMSSALERQSLDAAQTAFDDALTRLASASRTLQR